MPHRHRHAIARSIPRDMPAHFVGSRMRCAARDLRYVTHVVGHVMHRNRIEFASCASHANEARIGSAPFASIDTSGTSMHARAMHRLRASTRKIRACCRIHASFFSTRIALLARQRARRCVARVSSMHAITICTHATMRVAVNRHEHWVCGRSVSALSNALTRCYDARKCAFTRVATAHARSKSCRCTEATQSFTKTHRAFCINLLTSPRKRIMIRLDKTLTSMQGSFARSTTMKFQAASER